jgi:hypothetical protein
LTLNPAALFATVADDGDAVTDDHGFGNALAYLGQCLVLGRLMVWQAADAALDSHQRSCAVGSEQELRGLASLTKVRSAQKSLASRGPRHLPRQTGLCQTARCH